MRILVTGATGFVGKALQLRLRESTDFTVRGSTRTKIPASPDGPELVQVGELGSTTDWSQVLQGVDVVVHTAARVHVMNEPAEDALARYREVNVDGTRRLAEQAARVGVRRLVFLSSIKVNGESTKPGRPISAKSTPEPVDAYGISKFEAEKALFAIGRNSDLEIVVIRPPLVYGPGVGANFRAMIRVLKRGLPLPLSAIRNQRSLVFIDNLIDLIALCARSDEAPGQVFLVSDGEDLATPELLRTLAAGLGRRPRLFPVPVAVLRLLGLLTGKSGEVARLVGSLHVDISETCRRLGWKPPVSAEQGLTTTGRSFLSESDENGTRA